MKLSRLAKITHPKKLMLGASSLVALTIGFVAPLAAADTVVPATAHCAVTHPAVNTLASDTPDIIHYWRSGLLTVPHTVNGFTDTCNDINISNTMDVNGNDNNLWRVKFFPTSGTPYFSSAKLVNTGSSTLVVIASNVADGTHFELYASQPMVTDQLTD